MGFSLNQFLHKGKISLIFGGAVKQEDGCPITPDGRYFVFKERLWRCPDPNVPPERQKLLYDRIQKLYKSLKWAKRQEDLATPALILNEISIIRIELGEEGPPWWTDGARDYTRKKVSNSPYADWYNSLDSID